VASGEGPSEKSHKAKIKVGVALILSLVYEVKIPNDEPLRVICRLGGDNFRKETLRISMIARPIYRGELERGAASMNQDIGQDQVSADMNA
jgi:hypothetical protein